jgi:hypothetical protein
MEILAGNAKEKIFATGTIIFGGVCTLGTCAFLGVSGIWGRAMGIALGFLLGGFISTAIAPSLKQKRGNELVEASDGRSFSTLAQRFIGITLAVLMVFVPYVLIIHYVCNAGVPRRHDYAEILGWTLSYSLIYAGVRVLWLRKQPRPSVG